MYIVHSVVSLQNMPDFFLKKVSNFEEFEGIRTKNFRFGEIRSLFRWRQEDIF